MQNLWLAIALASLVTSPAIAAMSATVAPNSVPRTMMNRPGAERLNNAPHSGVPKDRPHIVISNHRNDLRLPFDSVDRFKRPFFHGGFPYGFYGGGVYADEGYDGGGGSTTNIIIDNSKQYETSAPSAKPERPAPGPHMVTLDHKSSGSASRKDTVIEIRGTTVSTVKLNGG